MFVSIYLYIHLYTNLYVIIKLTELLNGCRAAVANSYTPPAYKTGRGLFDLRGHYYRAGYAPRGANIGWLLEFCDLATFPTSTSTDL